MTDTHEEKMKIIQKRLEEFQSQKEKITLLRNLNLYDPNYSDEYKNLSVDELKVKWEPIKSLRGKAAEKIYPEHHYNPTIARERKKTLKPIFESLKQNVGETQRETFDKGNRRESVYKPQIVGEKICKHENTVESLEWPGRQICKDCAVVLPEGYGKTHTGVIVDDDINIVKRIPVDKLLKKQFKHRPMAPIQDLPQDKGEIPEVQSGNKEELLLKLKSLDPQYEINLEKYKH